MPAVPDAERDAAVTSRRPKEKTSAFRTFFCDDGAVGQKEAAAFFLPGRCRGRSGSSCRMSSNPPWVRAGSACCRESQRGRVRTCRGPARSRPALLGTALQRLRRGRRGQGVALLAEARESDASVWQQLSGQVPSLRGAHHLRGLPAHEEAPRTGREGGGGGGGKAEKGGASGAPSQSLVALPLFVFLSFRASEAKALAARLRQRGWNVLYDEAPLRAAQGRRAFCFC